MPSTLDANGVQRLERALYDAMVDKDVDVLDRLLSDDLRFIHSEASSHTKAEYLAALRDRYHYKKIESSDPINHFIEGVTVVSNIVSITSLSDGKPESVSRFRIAYVWREEPAGWRLLLRQATRLAG